MKITQINGRDKPWRRLKQNEISIFCKLPKKNKMLLYCWFFTCCPHPFSFRASFFIKRPYVSLYSYFHYVQTCWIWKTYLNTYVKNLKKHAHFKISSQDEVFTRLFFLLSSRDEISSLSFIPGWVHSGMEFHLGRNV